MRDHKVGNFLEPIGVLVMGIVMLGLVLVAAFVVGVGVHALVGIF